MSKFNCSEAKMRIILCKIIFLCILTFTCSSCATNSNFVEVRDMYVGSKVSWDPKAPPKISSHNSTQDEYLFESENGCQWVYYVNKETKIIESWAYVSSPDKCTLGYKSIFSVD